MRITTRKVIDIQTGKTLEHEWYEYDGPLAQTKKGRGEEKAATAGALSTGDTGKAIATTDVRKQQQEINPVNAFASELESTAPGELSPYAQNVYQNSLRNIARNYGDNMNIGLKALSYRGMGTAPSGYTSSVINTSNRDRDAAETEAYTQAQQNTLAGKMAAANLRTGLAGIYDPSRPLGVAGSAYGTAGQNAALLNQMGTPIGSIGMGLAGIGLDAAKLAGVGAPA